MTNIFIARYAGCCAACDDTFKKGTEIAYDLGGDIVHASCPAQVHTPREICPQCFLELPTTGRCSCRD
jgi:hypothetical protein